MGHGKLGRAGVGLFVLSAFLPATVLGQKNGQPASDLLGQEDLWGNPTFIGGVTNGGPVGHSIW